MMHMAANENFGGPEVAAFIAILVTGFLLIALGLSTFVDLRKAKIKAANADDMRQLVDRYEQLAEKSLDAQQRMAVDLSDLRTRAASIEQILRTVE